eukprot:278657-Prymnesium_polylepis.2
MVACVQRLELQARAVQERDPRPLCTRLLRGPLLEIPLDAGQREKRRAGGPPNRREERLHLAEVLRVRVRRRYRHVRQPKSALTNGPSHLGRSVHSAARRAPFSPRDASAGLAGARAW